MVVLIKKGTMVIDVSSRKVFRPKHRSRKASSAGEGGGRFLQRFPDGFVSPFEEKNYYILRKLWGKFVKKLCHL